MPKKEQWRTIGEVCVDSANLIICDPLQADKASEWCDDYFRKTDLNGAAINNQGAAQIVNGRGVPVGVITNTGLGDGIYKVEARYENHPAFGKRCAEIRIRFLPHPQFEIDDDDLAEMDVTNDNEKD